MKLPNLPLPALVTDAPAWVWTAALALSGLSAVVLLVWCLRIIRRGAEPAHLRPGAMVRSGLREAAEAAGPFAFLGTCGMLLSLHGLYGYATSNMGLDWYWALPLMAIFDVAEVACFASLYLAARTENQWTKPMRRTRRMAWLLVAASSAMNAAHAPGNTVSMVVFALVPIVSLKLIEHELESRLAANAEDDDQGAPPGLLRLMELYYQRFWADAFARLGFDPTGRGNAVHADARLRQAARRLRDLRRAIEAEEELKEGAGRRARRAHEQAKKATSAAQDKAELAIDVAGIAGDEPAQLTLARHLVTRGHVSDLATMDVEDPEGILSLLDKLAIVPSAEAIAAGTRAAQAEQRFKKAEEARSAAEAALNTAKEQTASLRKEVAEAQETAEKERQAAKAEALTQRDQAQAAERRAEESAAAAAKAIEQRDRVAAEIEQLTQHATALREGVTAASSREEATEGRLSKLREQIKIATDELARHQAAATTAQSEATAADQALINVRAEAENARTTLATLTDDVNDLRIVSERAEKLAAQRTDELRRLEEALNQSRGEVAQAAEQAARARREAEEADGDRNAALTALHTARLDIMDALTSPEDPDASPGWKSEAKMRGWHQYLHTVRTENREPSDTELAGDERDPSTARRWLADFRTELARMTAAALPAQLDARNHTDDRADSLVSA
ncbi:DUF2637 domain-containing protein [Streptomyces sp. NPDC059708]|uniref:DUF2637 domain-containing protein n=1 Tax=Streptomyces sp. NPDC059708 TaxID=3346916 RepID=UPI00369FD04C